MLRGLRRLLHHLHQLIPRKKCRPGFESGTYLLHAPQAHIRRSVWKKEAAIWRKSISHYCHRLGQKFWQKSLRKSRKNLNYHLLLHETDQKLHHRNRNAAAPAPLSETVAVSTTTTTTPTALLPPPPLDQVYLKFKQATEGHTARLPLHTPPPHRPAPSRNTLLHQLNELKNIRDRAAYNFWIPGTFTEFYCMLCKAECLREENFLRHVCGKSHRAWFLRLCSKTWDTGPKRLVFYTKGSWNDHLLSNSYQAQLRT